jgi:hypothetical protein
MRVFNQIYLSLLSTFAAEHRLTRGIVFWDVESIVSDAGAEFISQEYKQFCAGK